ncbi:MAG: DASS family sodium-coupled anion symporter [Thermodesulfobacteriota bacterium]
MILKNRWFLIGMAVLLGIVVILIPRPEGTVFQVSGDPDAKLLSALSGQFTEVSRPGQPPGTYMMEVKQKGDPLGSVKALTAEAKNLSLDKASIDYVNGLSPKAHRLLALLVALVVLFVAEPIPLEITAILIGVALTATGIADLKNAWAAYMHPVVVFIMVCLVFAIAVDKVGLTKRLGYAIAKRAGSSVVRFTFMLCIGLGIASSIMHDAAACAIGITAMLPLMRAVGIKPGTNTAKFMMLALPFACSCGGMGTLIGGGRCMAAAAFLKEFTGQELSFAKWTLYCLPAAVVCVLVAVTILYFLFRPDTTLKLPKSDESPGPFTREEIKTLAVTVLVFASWLTKSFHNLDYSVTGMIGVAVLVLLGILKWDDIHENLEWGTALFIFGGGISLGLAMDYSGAARYFANLFFPIVQGKGWLVLFAGIGVFGALATNVMANVAAAALVLPIAIPLAQMEGVNPAIIALCLGMATSFAFLLVIGCPPNAISYSYRYFKSSDLSKAGACVMPVLLLILVIYAATYWRLLGLVH